MKITLLFEHWQSGTLLPKEPRSNDGKSSYNDAPINNAASVNRMPQGIQEAAWIAKLKNYKITTRCFKRSNTFAETE